MNGMLHGIKVLDFTSNAAGPTAGGMLADYGADVIKVERPGRGDDGRQFPPMLPNGHSLSHCWFNRGKKSLAVDLTDPAGVEVIRRILPETNVIIESFRPGVMKKLGLDYESVCKIRPDIVYGSLSSFGQKGKYVDKPGYDIVAQAMSGYMSVTGEKGGPPMKVGVPIGDLGGGLNLYAAVMTALFHWKATGQGQYVDVSLLHTLIFLNSTIIHCNLGRCSTRNGNHHLTMAPYGLFEGKNGSLIIAAAGKKPWEALCDLMGTPELKADPKYKEVTDRAAHQDELIPLVNRWLMSYDDVGEAERAMDAAGVPCAKVFTNTEVWENEEFRANGWMTEIPTLPGMEDDMPTIIDRGPNAIFSKTPGKPARASLLGEQNHEIMKQYGYSDAEIEEMEARWAGK